MSQFQSPYLNTLSNDGLNLHAIFNIDEFPAEVITNLVTHCDRLEQYRQLILIGHGGNRLWQTLKQAKIESHDPIDDFTINAIRRLFETELKAHTYTILYPDQQSVNLQKLGELAGWHHRSPFWIGINDTWGTWYAYRAVVVTDTVFQPTKQVASHSPCEQCTVKACVNTCPAQAITDDEFSIQTCIDYRKRSQSMCKKRCLSRISCPACSQHRYSDEQMNYHYSMSMKSIERQCI